MKKERRQSELAPEAGYVKPHRMEQNQEQPDAGSNPAGWSRWVRIVVIGRNPKTTLMRAAFLIVTCFVVFKYILLAIQVDGISMLPTYKDGSWNLVNRFAYLRHEPQRGDVVSIRLAGIHRMYLKRIIGLPGETVSFEKGRVLIDGQVLDEPYEKTSCDWNYPAVKLGSDEYFAVGDNRTMPWQLHKFGRVDRAHIIGKAVL